MQEIAQFLLARKSVFRDKLGYCRLEWERPALVRATFEAGTPRYLADQALNGARNSSVPAEWIQVFSLLPKRSMEALYSTGDAGGEGAYEPLLRASCQRRRPSSCCFSILPMRCTLAATTTCPTVRSNPSLPCVRTRSKPPQPTSPDGAQTLATQPMQVASDSKSEMLYTG